VHEQRRSGCEVEHERRPEVQGGAAVRPARDQQTAATRGGVDPGLERRGVVVDAIAGRAEVTHVALARHGRTTVGEDAAVSISYDAGYGTPDQLLDTRV